MVYVFIYALVVALAYVNRRMTYRTRICSMIFVCGYLIFLMGLRYRVGIDTLNYMDGYDYIPDLRDLFSVDFSDTRFEPGYMFLCALCRTITPDFWLLQLAHSFLLNVLVFVFIYKHSRNPFIGIGVYMVLCWLYFNTEIIRESLAIAIFLLNYDNLKNKRWLRYYLVALLSISFQYSAVITLFFPLVRFLKFNVLYVIGCFLILGITPYVEQVNQLISIASVANRIEEHVNSAGDLNLNWRIANMVRYSIVPIFALFVSRYFNYKSEYTPFILLSILFGIGAFAIPIIFSRLANYTLLFVVIYVANLIDVLSSKPHFKYALISLVLCSQLLYYKEMFYAWYPYVSIFTEREVPEREALWYDYFS